MKIYVGCSLTHASDEYRKNIEILKKKLRKHFIVFDFIGLIDGTNEDVYKCDKNCVKTCDIMIAECSHPSLGLGYELGLGVEKGKPILAFAKKDALVSRMILGINKENFNFERYSNFDDLYDIIIEKLKSKNLYNINKL